MQHFGFCSHFALALWPFIDVDEFSSSTSIKGPFLPNNNLSYICLHSPFAEIIHPAHSCSISRCWPESLIIVQVILRLPKLKECAVLSHSTATDVASGEGACGWHDDCRKIHQRCCLWIECSFLYQSLSENLAVHPTAPAQHLHIQQLHLQDCVRAAAQAAATAVGLYNHRRSTQTVRVLLREARLHAHGPCQGLGGTDASGQMLTFNGVWHSRTLG